MGEGAKSRTTLRALLVSAAALICFCSAARAAAPLGSLSQLAGTHGCFSFDGSSDAGAATCGVARGIDGAESVVVSPDGRNVYVGSYANSTSRASITVFARDAATGALTQLSGTAGCLTDDGNSQAGAGTCTRVRGLTGTGDGRDLAITSDGRWAYFVMQSSSGGISTPAGILILRRNPTTGALTPLPGSAGCITADGSSQDGAGTCQTNATLVFPNGVTISGDDRFVYVTDYGTNTARLHVFSRNKTNGALTDIQCLARQQIPLPAECEIARVVGDDEAFMITPDGRHAYSGHYIYNGISIFDRNKTTGRLTQKPGTAGCITETGKDDTGASTCGVAHALKGAWVVTLSPNGHTLYVTTYDDVHGGIAVFHVHSDGTLTQLPGLAGCITIDGGSSAGPNTCQQGNALVNSYLTTISPDGRTLYASEWGNSPLKASGVAIFSLNPATGHATQLPGQRGCITTDGSSNGTAGVCTNGTATDGAYSIAISPDGGSAYLAAYRAQAVDVFKRKEAPLLLSHVRQSTNTWRVSNKLPKISRAHKPPVGTTFSFSLNEAAELSFAFVQTRTGRRVGGLCVPRTRQNRHHPHCSYTAGAGTLEFFAHAGANTVRFFGVIAHGHRLAAGDYTLVIVALNPAGIAVKRLKFTIAPG